MKKYRVLFTKILIRIGKLLPYLLCFIILIEHAESLYSFVNNILYNNNGSTILYTPISWFLCNYVRYSWMEILTLFILSISFDCCWRHRLAIYYLAINLVEKQVIESVIMDVKIIPYYLWINILVIIAILVLGINQWVKNKNHKQMNDK